MEEMITIPKKEYEELKRKADAQDDTLDQVKESLEDVKRGRVFEVTDPEDL